MQSKNLLIELLVEELPPKALKKLGDAFGTALFQGLKNKEHLDDGAVLTTFASPRRLAAHVSQVLPSAVSKPERTKLMPVAIALDGEKNPTPALIKKLKTLGLDYILSVNKSVWDERISAENDGKTETLFHTDVATGLSLEINLQQILDQALGKLPIPKMMGYQLADGWSTVNFVRPAHALVALHGADVVPIATLGLKAGRETHGHRFEAKLDPILIKDADSYAAQLENEGSADLAKRIVKLIKDSGLKVQASIQGDEVRVNGAKRDLLQEAIAFCKKNVTDFPLQFGNFRD